MLAAATATQLNLKPKHTMTPRTIIQEIASTIGALHRCQASEKTTGQPHPWTARHQGNLDQLAKELPLGSGIDCGTKIDVAASNDEKVVLIVSFHHMDDSGGYDGWTEHEIIVTPSFDGFNLKITGRNRNDIKDYLADVYHHALSQLTPETVYA